jgi:isocitrate dehydrogenase kinase/phosphatase
MEHASQIIEDEIFQDGVHRARAAVRYNGDELDGDDWAAVRPDDLFSPTSHSPRL